MPRVEQRRAALPPSRRDVEAPIGPLGWLLLGLLALAVSVAATWPYATRVSTHTFAPFSEADLQVGLWWPGAFVDGILEGHSPFFAKDLAWPEGQDVTLLIWNFGAELILGPIHTAAGPVLGLNIGTYLIMVLNGLASAWAGHATSGRRAGALVGLLVGATSAYAFAEAASGRPEQGLWAPIVIYLAALARLLSASPRRRDPWIVGASMAAAGAIYWFYAYLLVVITSLVFVALAVSRRLDRTMLCRLAHAGFISAGLAAPFVAPVLLAVSGQSGELGAITDSIADVVRQQIDFALTPSCFLGIFSTGRGFPSAQAPILLLPVLALVIVVGDRPARIVASAGMLAAIFAAGPALLETSREQVVVLGNGLMLPGAALNHLPGYARFWWPYRWLGVAIPALAISASWLAGKVRHPYGHCVWLGVLLALECSFVLRIDTRGDRPIAFPVPVPPVFSELAALPERAPILQLPIARLFNSALGWQRLHKQPIDGGVAWQVKGVPGEEYDRRRAHVPLFVELDSVLERGISPPRDTWNLEDTGGFQVVLLSKQEYPEMMEGLRQKLNRLLGKPCYEDGWMMLWSIPGVGPELDCGRSG